MTRVNRRRGSVIARIRDKLAGGDPIDSPDDTAPEPVAEPPPAPEPPRRVHLFGSQYRVKQSFEETMRQRGYTGQSALYRRRIAERGDYQCARDAVARRAGYHPGEVLWPTD